MRRFLSPIPLLLGCSALPAIGTGLQTARDVAKIGCAILEGTDGSSADVLAATDALRRDILTAQAESAKARGADAATIDGLVRSVAVLSETVRENAGKVVNAAGNGPAQFKPCPVCTPTPSCVLDAPGQPPAPAGQACSGGVCDGAGRCCAAP